LADYQVQRGNKAYLYFFAQNPPAPAGRPAFPAAHAAELPYVFDNLGELRLFPDGGDPRLAAASAPDAEVADRMSSYWTNFARNGDPNGPGLPVWQAHAVGASERALVIDAEQGTERVPAKPLLELHDALFEQLRASAE
jgi:para-nitrobenzyl esterase